MKKFNVFVNKKTINIQDRGFNFGDGVFETILVKENKPLHFTKHIKRMMEGCRSLKISTPPVNLMREYASKSISKTQNCILKIIITRGLSEQGYSINLNSKPNIYFNKIKNVPSLVKITGLKLKVSKVTLVQNSNLSGIKHMNRIEQSLASHEILHEKKEYDDLLLLDDQKNIIETISSNIFFIKENKQQLSFYSPKLSKSGINGIQRSVIIDFLKKKKNKVLIQNIKLSQLSQFQFAFICNSIKGIRFIKSINTVKFKEPEPVLALLERLI